MQLLSGITECWLGLCRKPPVVHALQEAISFPPEAAHAGVPDSGGSWPGPVRRGLGAAISGMKTLNRNPQLLWFTLLIGLLFAGNAILQAAFWYISHNLDMEPDWIAWQFFIELGTMFCLVFLTAGLVLSIPPGRAGTPSFPAGLAGAKYHLKALSLWAFILAIAGMLIVIIFSYVPAWYPTQELLFLYCNGFGSFSSFLMNTLSQFPFNPTLRWDLFTEFPGYGGRSVLLWIYPGLTDALIFSAINLLLFIVTLFVVPGIVLGQKTIREAALGSFALMKKTWAEVAACAVFLGGLAAGMFLMYMPVGAVHEMLAPFEIVNYQPSVTWILLAVLYDLAFFSVTFVMATVGGIAALYLYRSANT